MIVVDVNVLVNLLFDGPKTQVARDLYEMDKDWHAPELLMHELMNVLASMGKFKGVPIHDCEEAWKIGTIVMMNGLEKVNAAETLRLAIEQNIASYDAQYVILARARKRRLITEDHQLLKRFPNDTQSIADSLKRLSRN